jgi:hypothetical protein
MPSYKWKGRSEKTVMLSFRVTADDAKAIRAAHHQWKKTADWNNTLSSFIRDRILSPTRPRS